MWGGVLECGSEGGGGREMDGGNVCVYGGA